MERLSRKYGIDAPKLYWSHGRRKGIYRPQTDSIYLGPNAWNGVTDTLLHCITHAIVHKVSIDRELHGIGFLDTLWTVVLEYYKNPNLYGWYNEHNIVFEYGRNRLRMWDNE